MAITLEQLDNAIKLLNEMRGSMIRLQELHNGLWKRFNALIKEYDEYKNKTEAEKRRLQIECNTLRNKLKKKDKE